MPERGVIMLLIAATIVASAFAFTDISTPSTTPIIDTYEPNCSTDYWNTKCMCDPDCARYADCCRSSEYFVAEEQRLGSSPFKCLKLSVSYINVMATCPSNWQDYNTRRLCEEPSTIYQDILDAPVTSTGSNITYRNWYCALCHQDLQAETTIIWSLQLECYGIVIPNLTDSPETLVNSLRYNNVTSKWSIKTAVKANVESHPTPTQPTINGDDNCDDNNNLEEHECDLSFTSPTEAIRRQRGCKGNVTSQCAENWTDTEVQRACEAYTAYICSNQQTYRNYNCLICSNLPYEECYGGGGAAEPPVRSFSVILDWRRLKRNTCGSSQIYDPMAHICRRVYN